MAHGLEWNERGCEDGPVWQHVWVTRGINP